MSNPCVLEFSLKQHTPLIHFHDQEGATLRVTELKPKLDKFILKDLNAIRPDLYKAVKNCFIKRDGKTFGNYKLHITASGTKQNFIIGSMNAVPEKHRNNVPTDRRYLGETSYFADAEKISKGIFTETRFGLKYSEIKCTVFTLHTELKNNFLEICDYFFAIHSFGTRQNKGFGCFYRKDLKLERLKSIYNEIIEKPSNIIEKPSNIKAIYSRSSTANQSLQHIKADYQLLKAGLNHRDYRKSLLWAYFFEDLIRWEKRIFKFKFSNDIWHGLSFRNGFKRNFISDITTEDGDLNAEYKAERENKKEQFAYIRALLGLAEHFEFKTKDSSDSVKVNVTHSQKTIERFASPILFKVFNDTIFLIAFDVPEKILGSAFTFDVNAKINKKDFSEKNFIGENLKVPSKFDIADFLQFSLDETDYRVTFYENVEQVTGYTKLN